MFETRGLPKSPQPIIYLSGFTSKLKGMSAEEETRIMLDKGKVKHRCYSHAFCCKGGVHFSKHIETTLMENAKRGTRVMMDSGAFSFHQALRKMGKAGGWSPEQTKKFRDQTIESYVEFCRKYSKDWDFLINYDYRVHAPTVYDMQKKLERLGMRPVPVFHGDNGMDWLHRYCKEGYKLICIGGITAMAGRTNWKSKRIYYESVFEVAEKYGVQLHALAQTSISLMFQFPWFSVDSATWAIIATYGCILDVNESTGKIGPLHVSVQESKTPNSYARMPKHVQQHIQDRVEKSGFDFQKIRESPFWRSIYNAMMFSTKVMDLKERESKGRVEWETLI